MNKNPAPETFVVYHCLEVIPYYKKTMAIREDKRNAGRHPERLVKTWQSLQMPRCLASYMLVMFCC